MLVAYILIRSLKTGYRNITYLYIMQPEYTGTICVLLTLIQSQQNVNNVSGKCIAHLNMQSSLE